MKLGLFLLVFGLLLAGGGASVWIYADVNAAIWGVGNLSPNKAQLADAGGFGLLIFGGGLSIGGIVRMVVKR